MTDKEPKSLKANILAEYEKGNVVVSTHEGLKVVKLEDLLKQPIEGLLYDINRDKATILTFIEDPKWVNDLALTAVVRELKRQVGGWKYIKDGHLPDDNDNDLVKLVAFANNGVSSGHYNDGFWWGKDDMFNPQPVAWRERPAFNYRERPLSNKNK